MMNYNRDSKNSIMKNQMILIVIIYQSYNIT